MKGKSISLFLALIMVFTSVNIPVFAEDIAAETENPPVTEVTEATPEPSASPTPEAFELPMLKEPVKLPVTLPSPEAEKDNIEAETTASPQPTAEAPTVTAEPSLDLKTIPLRANAFKPMALTAGGDITADLQSDAVEITEEGAYTVTNASGGIIILW